jgi:hypothetical protein
MAWAAIIGHELAHAIVMWPVAERVRLVAESPKRILLGDFDVESDIKNEEWRHKWADVAGVAPLLIGFLALPILFFSGRLPGVDTLLGVAFWNAWLWFSVLGGITDYSRSASLGETTPFKDSDLVTDGGPGTGVTSMLPLEHQEWLADQERVIGIAMWSSLAAALSLMFGSLCYGLPSTVGQSLGTGALVLLAGAGAVLFVRRVQHVGYD